MPLKPMASPRPRVTRRGITYMPANYTKWKKDFAACIPYQLKTASERPCVLFCELVVGIPKSYTKKQREAVLGGLEVYPRLDCDNAVKSIQDAMNGIVFKDDNQVVELHAKKRYGEQDAVIVEVVFL